MTRVMAPIALTITVIQQSVVVAANSSPSAVATIALVLKEEVSGILSPV